MMEMGNVAGRVVFLIMLGLAFGASGFFAQSPPPPPAPPVIKAMNFDRLAIGDELVLTGTGFKPDSDVPIPALVSFTQNVQVSVVAESDTTIRVTVPNGAKTGPVTATITAVVDGTTHTQISNTANLLVIFKSAPQRVPYIWSVLAGDEDDFYGVSYWPGNPTVMVGTYRITPDGTEHIVSNLYYNWWSSSKPNRLKYYAESVARNTLTKKIYSLYSDSCTDYYRCSPRQITWQIRNLVTAAPILTMVTYYDSNGHTAEYTPKVFGFDAEGNLLIAAQRDGSSSALQALQDSSEILLSETWEGPCASPPETKLEGGVGGVATSTGQGAFNFWRFPAASLNGQAVVLDPATALMVTPGQFLESYDLEPRHFSMSVASDGTGLFRYADCLGSRYSGICEDRVWIIPPPGSLEAPRDLNVPLPPPPDKYHFQDLIMNSTAVDCKGRFYVQHKLWDLTQGIATSPIYSLSKGGSLGEYQLSLVVPALIQGSPAICPLAPTGFWGITTDGYGNLYEPGRDRPTDRLTYHRFTQCELSDPHYYEGFDCCATQAAAKAEALRAGQAPAQVGVPFPITGPCPLPGNLKLKLTYDPATPCPATGTPDPDKCVWFEASASNGEYFEATVAFGEAPLLETYWEESGSSTPSIEKVKWTWKSEDEVVQGADPEGLFPRKPELLFFENATNQETTKLRFQTVHLGYFTLTATTTDPKHFKEDGRTPASMTIRIFINASRLRDDCPKHNAQHYEYDEHIVFYSNKYGIPPQYIKSQVAHETVHTFDAKRFRFELKSYDLDKIALSRKWDWSKKDYFMYRFPRTLPGSQLSDEDVEPRNEYSYIAYQDLTPTPPNAWPYECGTFTTQDASVTTLSLYQANDGWPDGSYPNKYYGKMGPCSTRENWMKVGGLFMAWHNGEYYCGSQASDICRVPYKAAPYAMWFQNNPTYEAQTAICSSYGLMQVMYTTAVEDARWRSDGTGADRPPADLFIPTENLDVGVWIDARNISRELRGAISSFSVFESKLKDGFQAYNPGRGGYGPGIVNQAKYFKPRR